MMLDQTLVNIISTIIGFTGLVGAITKYSFPKARNTVFNQNLFLLKEDIINSTITWFFTIYAGIGLIFQIIYNGILGDITPIRIYQENIYAIALVCGLLLAIILIPAMKAMSKWVSRSFWQKEIIKKSKDNFLLAQQSIEQALQSKTENSLSDSHQAIKILNWLEELFETKSQKSDIRSRIEHFRPFFNSN